MLKKYELVNVLLFFVKAAPKTMILIVDDIRANIVALKKILELHNLDVDTASSGEEAMNCN